MHWEDIALGQAVVCVPGRERRRPDLDAQKKMGRRISPWILVPRVRRPRAPGGCRQFVLRCDESRERVPSGHDLRVSPGRNEKQAVREHVSLPIRRPERDGGLSAMRCTVDALHRRICHSFWQVSSSSSADDTIQQKKTRWIAGRYQR